MQGLIKKSLLSGAIAAAAFAAAPTQSDAALVYDIRVTGGTAFGSGGSFNAGGGTIGQTGTVIMQVWGRVSGADANNANEFLQTNYLTVVSQETGDLIGASTMTGLRAAPFNAGGGRNGASTIMTDDGVADWGSTSTAITNPAYMLSRSLGPTQMGTPLAGTSVQVDANTWDHRLANFTLNITALGALGGETRMTVAKPNAPTAGSTEAYAIWWEDAPFNDPDGIPDSGDETFTTDSSNSEVANSASPATLTLYGDFITLSPIPEPTSLALLGLVGAGMLSRRRRA